EVDALKAQLETQLASTLKAGDPSTQHGIETNQGDTFGQYKLPPRPAINSNMDNAKVNEFQYQEQDDVAFSGDAFDSFEFHWQAS
ncbi:conjugal transfer protein TraB, partial [Vibrio lentus]|nr:conjugal transfer protein TraB [Vibrio lentus]